MSFSRKNLILPLVAPVALAIILLSSALALSSAPALTNAGTSHFELPGVALSDSPFAELATDSLTPIESIVYPNTYVVKSQKPYVIEIDYQEEIAIFEATAKLIAWEFIENVFTPEEVQQLSIDDRCTRLWGVLPRWTISFWNNTFSEPHSFVATVIVNAISGGIVAYYGEPILNLGRVENQTIAESHVLTSLQNLGYLIPRQSRYIISNCSNMNRMIYRLEFLQVTNAVLVHSGIGSIVLNLDAESGGILFLAYHWVPIDEIPIEDIVTSDRIGDGAVLSLTPVPLDGPNGLNELGPYDFRLCWLIDIIRHDEEIPWTIHETLVIDAFSGEIVETVGYLGASTEQDERIMFLLPIIGAFIPSVVAYALTRKLIHKRACA